VVGDPVEPVGAIVDVVGDRGAGVGQVPCEFDGVEAGQAGAPEAVQGVEIGVARRDVGDEAPAHRVAAEAEPGSVGDGEAGQHGAVGEGAGEVGGGDLTQLGVRFARCGIGAGSVGRDVLRGNADVAAGGGVQNGGEGGGRQRGRVGRGGVVPHRDHGVVQAVPGELVHEPGGDRPAGGADEDHGPPVRGETALLGADPGEVRNVDGARELRVVRAERQACSDRVDFCKYIQRIGFCARPVAEVEGGLGQGSEVFRDARLLLGVGGMAALRGKPVEVSAHRRGLGTCGGEKLGEPGRVEDAHAQLGGGENAVGRTGRGERDAVDAGRRIGGVPCGTTVGDAFIQRDLLRHLEDRFVVGIANDRVYGDVLEAVSAGRLPVQGDGFIAAGRGGVFDSNLCVAPGGLADGLDPDAVLARGDGSGSAVGWDRIGRGGEAQGRRAQEKQRKRAWQQHSQCTPLLVGNSPGRPRPSDGEGASHSRGLGPACQRV